MHTRRLGRTFQKTLKLLLLLTTMSTTSLLAPTLRAPSESSRVVKHMSEASATATIRTTQPTGAEQCELQLLQHFADLGTTVKELFGNNDCTCRACTPFLSFRSSGWCFMRSRHLHIVTNSSYGFVPVRPDGVGLYELQHLAAATTEQFSRRKQDLSTLQRDAIADFSRLWHSGGVATGTYPPNTPKVFEEIHWMTVARFLDHIFFFGTVGPFEFEWSKDDGTGPSAQLSHRRIHSTATVCRIAMRPETCAADERVALGSKRLGHVLSGMLEAFLYRYACRNCPEWSISHTRVFQMVALELEKRASQLLPVPGIDLGRVNRLMCNKVASIQTTSVHDLQRFGFLRAPSSSA